MSSWRKMVGGLGFCCHFVWTNFWNIVEIGDGSVDGLMVKGTKKGIHELSSNTGDSTFHFVLMSLGKA